MNYTLAIYFANFAKKFEFEELLKLERNQSSRILSHIDPKNNIFGFKKKKKVKLSRFMQIVETKKLNAIRTILDHPVFYNYHCKNYTSHTVDL